MFLPARFPLPHCIRVGSLITRRGEPVFQPKLSQKATPYLSVRSQRLSADHKALHGIYPGMLNRGIFANAGITPRDVTHHQLTYDSSFVCDLADPFSHDQLFLIVGAVLIQLTTEERPRWPKEAGVANMDQSLKGKKQLDGYLLAAQYEPMFSNGRRYGFVEGVVGTRFFHPGTTSDEYWTGEPTAQEEMEDYMIEQINKDD